MPKQDDKKHKESTISNNSPSQPPNCNHLIEINNLHSIIILREGEIASLRQDNDKKCSQIVSLESEVAELRLSSINRAKNERDVKQLREAVSALEKELRRSKDDMISLRLQCEEEIRLERDRHQQEIHRMGATVENYHQKVEMVTQLTLDNGLLREEIEKLKQATVSLTKQTQQALQSKEIANQNKFSSLKRKMMTNINRTQSKVTELNVQFMDVSSKLTVLQNQQLLIQLEYKTQEIEELNEKKAALEQKVFELSKDIEIHKEVELSLAEKNKKLRLENKRKSISEGMSIGLGDNVHNSSMHMKKTSINQTANSDISLNPRECPSFLALEKKVAGLEKKLLHKSNDYKVLKDQYEYIEVKMRNYEAKYGGLFVFFEEALKKFAEDEELKKKEIHVHVDSLSKCDFDKCSKEEKYSILVLLMKYLLPLSSITEWSINCSKDTTKSNLITYQLNAKSQAKKPVSELDVKSDSSVSKCQRKVRKNTSYEGLPLLRILRK